MAIGKVTKQSNAVYGNNFSPQKIATDAYAPSNKK